jgi:formylglycine-generating enzyme required for sulfatase activity
MLSKAQRAYFDMFYAERGIALPIPNDEYRMTNHETPLMMGNRELRGASWGNGGRVGMLSSYRNHHPIDFRFNNCGFRCVLASSPLGASTTQRCPVGT